MLRNGATTGAIFLILTEAGALSCAKSGHLQNTVHGFCGSCAFCGHGLTAKGNLQEESEGLRATVISNLRG